MTLELHHMIRFADGGCDDASNLIALCPNCHTRHHDGEIPMQSLKIWKQNQLALSEAFHRDAISTLLLLNKLEQLPVSGDALLRVGELIVSGYAEIVDHRVIHWNSDGSFSVRDGYGLKLTAKGKLFTDNWINGKQSTIDA